MSVSDSEDLNESSNWVKYSEVKLIELEKQILSVLNTPYEGSYVTINLKGDRIDKIWTISMNTESPNIPLVLLHGFGAGVGFWCLNLDAFAANRPVYAIDILGFGRSTRPSFSNDCLEAEQEFIRSIELWAVEMNLDTFILLGHSMGAYLATGYAITHPNRVRHLILADPWGFSVDYKRPLWMRTLSLMLYPFTMLNPLATLRVAGPLGPWIIRIVRSDITNKYTAKLQNHKIMADYIYQCNSQSPTGETAFHSMIKGFGWAKYPMLNRSENINPDLPITVMYGADTWMDTSSGPKLKNQRPDCYVKLETIPDAGHHIHADNPASFNEVVLEACDFTG